MSAETFVVIVLASILAAFVKGVTGLGYPLIVVPLVTLVTGVADAVVVVALPNLLSNLWLCWRERGARSDARDLRQIVFAGVIGAVVGTLALVELPEEPILALLVITVAAFVVQFFRHPHLELAPAMTRRWAPVAGGLTGLMQGAVGASGPVIATWLHGYRLTKSAYVFSMTLIFSLTGLVQISVLGSQGELTTDRLAGSLAAVIPIVVMVPIGTRLRERLAGPVFERAVLAVLVGAAASVVVQMVT